MEIHKASDVRFLARTDGRIAYTLEGTGPLVVAVPGMGDLRSTFRELTGPLLGAGFSVAVMDLRGHGASDTTFLADRGTPDRTPPGVRFVLTLDADTRLPRGAARRLVGKIGGGHHAQTGMPARGADIFARPVRHIAGRALREQRRNHRLPERARPAGHHDMSILKAHRAFPICRLAEYRRP